ncbi:MAG: hypothetical protein M1834_001468 [Cirrosporium novae-zelandiae]|nr:MAG: hypothetical protein M1834_008626 [Cirrosporium novae-zelandiae]KAI9736002.1 MAG: hypothetical protein M1834_001468 [Cirrosporium novae-zelandiae]
MDMDSDFDEEQLLSYFSADLVRYILKSPPLPSSHRVSFLSSNFVVKQSLPKNAEDDVRAMNMARQLGIRVPSMKRTIEIGNNVYFIMERINGVTLEDSWVQIGWIATIRLAIQLRQFVRRLRSVTSSTAGSLSSGECRSFWLDDRYNLPLHSTPEVIMSFIKFWIGFSPSMMRRPVPKQVAPCSQQYLPRTPTSLVFTHHDLAPRNIIVDNCGHLWLLDWEYSGWYPIYFEYASMQNSHVPQNWG